MLLMSVVDWKTIHIFSTWHTFYKMFSKCSLFSAQAAIDILGFTNEDKVGIFKFTGAVGIFKFTGAASPRKIPEVQAEAA